MVIRMYDNPNAAMAAGTLGSGAAVLPYTGIDAIWLLLASFALLAAGSALLRIAPKRKERRHHNGQGSSRQLDVLDAMLDKEAP